MYIHIYIYIYIYISSGLEHVAYVVLCCLSGTRQITIYGYINKCIYRDRERDIHIHREREREICCLCRKKTLAQGGATISGGSILTFRGIDADICLPPRSSDAGFWRGDRSRFIFQLGAHTHSHSLTSLSTFCFCGDPPPQRD